MINIILLLILHLLVTSVFASNPSTFHKLRVIPNGNETKVALLFQVNRAYLNYTLDKHFEIRSCRINSISRRKPYVSTSFKGSGYWCFQSAIFSLKPFKTSYLLPLVDPPFSGLSNCKLVHIIIEHSRRRHHVRSSFQAPSVRTLLLSKERVNISFFN